MFSLPKIVDPDKGDVVNLYFEIDPRDKEFIYGNVAENQIEISPSLTTQIGLYRFYMSLKDGKSLN